jgi:hypothetical protein
VWGLGCMNAVFRNSAEAEVANSAEAEVAISTKAEVAILHERLHYNQTS